MSKSSIHDPVPGRTVYTIGGPSSYSNWMRATEVDSMEDASFVVLTGGADWDSSTYNRRPHPTSYSSPNRDRFEIAEFKKARALDKPVVGVCRGAQGLAIFAGAILVQDQSHPYYHEIETEDGRKLKTNSLHHQSAFPWVLPADQYRVIAWANNESSHHWGESYRDELENPGGKEAEIVLYPAIRSLGYQMHPELMYDDYDRSPSTREFIDYSRYLLTRFLDGTL